MRIGVVLPTYDQFANAGTFSRLVREIEDLGYDSAWFGDHIAFPREIPDYLDARWMEAMTCAIHGLGQTSRLAFGTDVLVAPYRDPVLLAKMASTASLLSSGRLLLGMGIGWLEGEFEALNAPPFARRAKVTEEYLKVMRLLFEQEGPVSFSGDWISFKDIQFAPRSAPPLIVGGNHTKAIQRAAFLGDGWHPLFSHPQEYAHGRVEIERIRREEGISRPFLFSYSCSQTSVQTGSSPAPEAHPAQADKGSSYAPPFPCDADGRQRFKGTAAQLREDCRIYADAGVEQLVVRFAVTRDRFVDEEAYMTQLRRFAGEVVPFCEGL